MQQTGINGTRLTESTELVGQPVCSEEQRARPQSWLECIDELESSGQDDYALREREAFESEFPDYVR